MKIHTGVDLSYGKKSVMTYCHPLVYSPVSGIIVKIINEENKKEIRIKSKIGEKGKEKEYLHILEHFDSIENGFIEGRTQIAAGKPIGRMGGTGRTGRYHYNQHVHYEIRMKAYNLKENFLPVNLSEGIDNIVEEGDMMYLDPEAFWNKREESGIFGFIKSKEPQMEEGASKKKEIRKDINIVRKKLLIDDPKSKYQIGEMSLNGKSWISVEKRPMEEGMNYETICKMVEENEKKYIKNMEFNKLEIKNEISMMIEKSSAVNSIMRSYALAEGKYNALIESNTLELNNTKFGTPKIREGEDSKDFGADNDIFICKDIWKEKNKTNGEFIRYVFKESKEAMEELMTEIEESKGDSDILKVGVNISKYVKAKKSGSLVERVKEAMKAKDYTIFTQPYVLNIVGIRSKNRVANKFDDKMVVFYYDDKGEEVVASKNGEKEYWDITTDPGNTFLNYVPPKKVKNINRIEKELRACMKKTELIAFENENKIDLASPSFDKIDPRDKGDWRKYGRNMNKKGGAILKNGQYLNCFCIDLHAGSYKAICQIQKENAKNGEGKLTVYRDKNEDNILDLEGVVETGYFDIDIHKPYLKCKVKQTELFNYSAGCQVFANPKEFDELMELAKKQYLKQGISKELNARYTYTLFHEEEVE